MPRRSDLLVKADDIRGVLPARAARPLLIVEVAVPREVDSAVGHIPGVTLLDLDDLR
jgi:glutamyl-tRNA reductase